MIESAITQRSTKANRMLSVLRSQRIKIEDNTANPTYITTVWGYGYKWGL